MQECGMVRDFDNPSVRLPESVANGANLNPTNEDVIETVSHSSVFGEKRGAVGSEKGVGGGSEVLAGGGARVDGKSLISLASTGGR